ncbi:hypothetical protein [Mycolicibacterium sp. GF69]|uniref:hypothetical protein n=1 Tax=Mycolicibacterium sp. GF69 TaxID=2267251 RepID=UPI0010576070|nr:hypothetical protein [Mycolicibacterium sp. GF69]
MTTTHTEPTQNTVTGDALALASTPTQPEPNGAIWVDFGDGGSARWAGLSMATIDQVCAHLETVKKPDTLT